MSHRPSGRTQRSPAQWQALFERFSASGESATAFWRHASISASSFYRWRQKLDRAHVAPVAAPPPRAAFIDAGALAGESQTWTDLQPQANALPWDIELDLGTGIVLRRC